MGARERRRRQARLSATNASESHTRFRPRPASSITPRPATPRRFLFPRSGVERIRTTAESHRRIAIIEVMGRHSGYIALGTAYGQPDIILVPEHPLDLEHAGRARETSLRSAEKRRHRLRRRHRGRTGPRTGRGNEIHRSGRQHRVERRGRGVAVEADPDDRRQIFPALPPRRFGQGSDLHAQSRPHAARRPADSVRPVLRGAARRKGGGSAGGRPQQRRFRPAIQHRRRVFTSKATTPTVFATAGA